MEGVTFKYEPPLAHDESDPEAEHLARALATMDSEHSSQARVVPVVISLYVPGAEGDEMEVIIVFAFVKVTVRQTCGAVFEGGRPPPPPLERVLYIAVRITLASSAGPHRQTKRPPRIVVTLDDTAYAAVAQHAVVLFTGGGLYQPIPCMMAAPAALEALTLSGNRNGHPSLCAPVPA